MDLTPRTILGLDLGQASDYTALAVVREAGADDRGRTVWGVPLLKRWQLGTDYASIVADVTAHAHKIGSPVLVVDGTGVGRPVVDLLRRAGLPGRLEPIVITSGHAITIGDDGYRHLPKKELVGTLQVLLQQRRLKIASWLPEAATLKTELEVFKVKVTTAANETFEAWRERDHDDLVLALALACWEAERPQSVGAPIVVPPDPDDDDDRGRYLRLGGWRQD